MCEEAKAHMESGTEAEVRCWTTVWVGDLREHLLLLLIYYRTYTTHLFLAQIFKVDEATICRAIKRFERFFIKNPSKLDAF